jgi:hypothetical protein
MGFLLGTTVDAATLLEGVQTGLMSQIAGVLPIAGTVMASIAGIFIGVKIFKRLTGARTN